MSKKPLTVLFVDDEATIREHMADTLNLVFEKVLIGSDGDEAKVLLRDNDVDILISDINMPKVSGVDLISTVREATTLLPIIVATGYSEFKEVYENVYNIYVITKPYDIREIVEIIEGAEKELCVRKQYLESFKQLEKAQKEAAEALKSLRGV